MDNRYSGMTVNERLVLSGLLSEFDEAIAKKNLERIRRVLLAVELTEESIFPILERYGLARRQQG
jgi:hypothetical protein